MNAVVVVLVVVAVLLIVGVIGFNGIIRLRNRTDEAFAQIDVQLRRRYDLIPNLVETVKGYAAHERGVFEAVTSARSQAMSAQGPAATGEANGLLTGALGRLIAVAEAYPDLKANQNFLALQEELTATENKIAFARQFYNDSVRAFNTKIETVPWVWIKGLAHASRREYFALEPGDAARQVPQVKP